MTLRSILAGPTITLAATAAVAQDAGQPASFEGLYAQSCSACHGETLEGSPTGAALNGAALVHGSTIDDISRSIAAGFPAAGMQPFADSLSDAQIRGLAILIVERRSALSYADFKVGAPLQIPSGVQSSEAARFRIETVATGLDPFPFSIQPLPDGHILLVEKTKGLSIVSPDGVKSPFIEGAPKAYDDSFLVPGLEYIVGNGWLMDVAVDPDYADDGWVYLQYGDRCSGCNAMSREVGRPVSMNKLVRGRIRDGRWVDEQVLWQAPIEQYTWMVDQAAGGRIAFDDADHVYISIGIKGTSNFDGIQDLSKPYGKILRLDRDGSIPGNNPFVGRPGALAAIWTYGHRSPQGLEFDRHTRELWGTEMGPRGGDEVNLLLPGRNYGWPLYSKGINYDGTEVDYGRNLGIERDIGTIEQPVVDLTPAPAVSSFIFYAGDAFPFWRHNMLVGTLKATELYRFVLDGNTVVHRETLLSGIGRIRDIEAAADGSVLLLIEHKDGGRILRIVSAATAQASRPSFLGEWTATAHTPGGEVSETLSVTRTNTGYAIAAQLVGPVAEGTPQAGPGTDIVIDADRFTYKRRVAAPGGGLEITYSGVVAGDTFKGTVDMGFAKVPYTGVRK